MMSPVAAIVAEPLPADSVPEQRRGIDRQSGLAAVFQADYDAGESISRLRQSSPGINR